MLIVFSSCCSAGSQPVSPNEKNKWGGSDAASSGPYMCACERKTETDTGTQEEKDVTHSVLVSVLKYIDDTFIYLFYLSCPVYKQN